MIFCFSSLHNLLYNLSNIGFANNFFLKAFVGCTLAHQLKTFKFYNVYEPIYISDVF